jgi:hypothetical protein
VIEDVVDLCRALGGHYRDQVERPAHRVQGADNDDPAQRLLHMVTPLGADGDGDLDAPAMTLSVRTQGVACPSPMLSGPTAIMRAWRPR